MKYLSYPAYGLLLALVLAVFTCQHEAKAQSFTVSPPITVFTPQQLGQVGIDFPDGAIGVVKRSGSYVIFGAGGSFGNIGPGGNPTGSYEFAGTLDSFSPAHYTSAQHPTPALQIGRVQPSPDGRDFDRDYAGGGATYAFSVDGTPELVQIYHGEYHPDYPAGSPWYGGSGMAVSDNNGSSFTKVGQIIAPSITLQQFLNSLGSNQDQGLPVDGFMIEADEYGRPVGPGTADDQLYLYDIFSDRNATDARVSFGIARVKKADLIEAISLHKAPQFKKYYAPGGGFTEPGLGGKFTPIVTQGTDALAWPQATYCNYLGQFLLFYQTNQRMVQVRLASSLMKWGSPFTLVNNPTDPRTFYPAAVGLTHDQLRLDKQFYLFYQRRFTNTNPANPTYYRSTVTINP